MQQRLIKIKKIEVKFIHIEKNSIFVALKIKLKYRLMGYSYIETKKMN